MSVLCERDRIVCHVVMVPGSLADENLVLMFSGDMANIRSYIVKVFIASMTTTCGRLANLLCREFSK